MPYTKLSISILVPGTMQNHGLSSPSKKSHCGSGFLCDERCEQRATKIRQKYWYPDNSKVLSLRYLQNNRDNCRKKDDFPAIVSAVLFGNRSDVTRCYRVFNDSRQFSCNWFHSDLTTYGIVPYLTQDDFPAVIPVVLFGIILDVT